MLGRGNFSGLEPLRYFFKRWVQVSLSKLFLLVTQLSSEVREPRVRGILPEVFFFFSSLSTTPRTIFVISFPFSTKSSKEENVFIV